MKININNIDKRLLDRAIEYIVNKYYIDKKENFMITKFEIKPSKIVLGISRFEEESIFTLRGSIKEYVCNSNEDVCELFDK